MNIKTTSPRSKHKAKSELLKIPGIGPSLSQDLIDLGYHQISDLKNADPQAMYDKLIALRQSPIDRCVLYTFRCAVYFASESTHETERLKWWNWKD